MQWCTQATKPLAWEKGSLFFTLWMDWVTYTPRHRRNHIDSNEIWEGLAKTWYWFLTRLCAEHKAVSRARVREEKRSQQSNHCKSSGWLFTIPLLNTCTCAVSTVKGHSPGKFPLSGHHCQCEFICPVGMFVSCLLGYMPLDILKKIILLPVFKKPRFDLFRNIGHQFFRLTSFWEEPGSYQGKEKCN